jgi:hypothetical protein
MGAFHIIYQKYRRVGYMYMYSTELVETLYDIIHKLRSFSEFNIKFSLIGISCISVSLIFLLLCTSFTIFCDRISKEVVFTVEKDLSVSFNGIM